MKIENLKLVPAKSGMPQGKSVATSSRTIHAVAKTADVAPNSRTAAAGVKQSVAGEERRRSQRVLLRVRANVHVALQGKTSTFAVTTLSVNDHGALIVMPRSLPLETRVVLEHGITQQKVTCKIVRVPREMPEGFHIPLEFDTPEPGFWGIAFPSPDWRPPEDL